jgi:aminoglycoside phosphotransferase (APT) family kinase protein
MSDVMVRMHDGEVDIDADLVRRLLADQLPHLSKLPISQVRSTGTVNAIYRIGADLYARLPRVRDWADDLANEAHWLPRLAPLLPLAVPAPVAMGIPAAGYPFQWAIYRWLDGETYAPDHVSDERQSARDLAGFVSALRRVRLQGRPRTRPHRPLLLQDAGAQSAIAALGPSYDRPAVTAAWQRALAAPAWDGEAVWSHGDLLPPNLLVRHCRLSAVIDFGSVGVGDPAADVIPSWCVFGQPGRETFRAALGVDDHTWARARGLALHKALLIIPYYAETNPGFVAMATRTIDEVLDDVSGDPDR